MAHSRAADRRIECAFLAAGRVVRERAVEPAVGAVFCSLRCFHGLIKAEKGAGIEVSFALRVGVAKLVNQLFREIASQCFLVCLWSLADARKTGASVGT
jgi:hypothetical protein